MLDIAVNIFQSNGWKKDLTTRQRTKENVEA